MASTTQTRTSTVATDELRQAEFDLFTIDKKMSAHVDNLQNAQEAFALQADLDKERYNRI